MTGKSAGEDVVGKGKVAGHPFSHQFVATPAENNVVHVWRQSSTYWFPDRYDCASDNLTKSRASPVVHHEVNQVVVDLREVDFLFPFFKGKRSLSSSSLNPVFLFFSTHPSDY
jgi:hypothetical protein